MTSKIRSLLLAIIQCESLHAKWLNTLSYLENCGARKIASCEHPTFVKENMLKHAAEEFRHSHYLKCQIKKVASTSFDNFTLPFILGGISSLRYLDRLDLFASQFLIKDVGLSKERAKMFAYHLVTYAIELRAQQLYPVYHETLRMLQAKIYVKSILLEEEEHLREMEEGLKALPLGFVYARKICAFEEGLFQKWIETVANEVFQ
jgi:hypothetical protein